MANLKKVGVILIGLFVALLLISFFRSLTYKDPWTAEAALYVRIPVGLFRLSTVHALRTPICPGGRREPFFRPG